MELRRWDPLRSTSIPMQNVKVRLTKNIPEKFSRNLRIWWFLTLIFTIPSLLEQNTFDCYTHLFQNKSATWKTFTNCRNPWLWGIILLHITPIKTPFFHRGRFVERRFTVSRNERSDLQNPPRCSPFLNNTHGGLGICQPKCWQFIPEKNCWG